MKKFIIKNRPKRKYTKKQNPPAFFGYYRSAAISLIPALFIIVSCFSLIILFQNRLSSNRQQQFAFSLPAFQKINLNQTLHGLDKNKNALAQIISDTMSESYLVIKNIPANSLKAGTNFFKQLNLSENSKKLSLISGFLSKTTTGLFIQTSFLFKNFAVFTINITSSLIQSAAKTLAALTSLSNSISNSLGLAFTTSHAAISAFISHQINSVTKVTAIISKSLTAAASNTFFSALKFSKTINSALFKINQKVTNAIRLTSNTVLSKSISIYHWTKSNALTLLQKITNIIKIPILWLSNSIDAYVIRLENSLNDLSIYMTGAFQTTSKVVNFLAVELMDTIRFLTNIQYLST
jgi:hypothetical protein